MPCIFFCEPLANEDVSEMPSAFCTNDLRPAAIGIGYTKYGTGDLIIKTRPAAMRIKFIIRAI